MLGCVALNSLVRAVRDSPSVAAMASQNGTMALFVSQSMENWTVTFLSAAFHAVVAPMDSATKRTGTTVLPLMIAAGASSATS